MGKTDRSTLTLVIIALMGIVLSSFLLIKGQFGQSSQRDESERIATINRFEQDIRLKMAGDLHWYPVTQEVYCFIDDTIFSGPDSKAILDLVNGGTITLYPNTLVVLSEGRVSLESGTLEINLTQGQMEIESFGEVIKVTPEEKIKIENTEKFKRIVPLAGKQINHPLLKNYIEKIQISLERPRLLEKVPKITGNALNFKWTASLETPQSNYLLEISNQETFENILLSKNVNALNYQIPSEELPSGPLYWRVSQGNIKESSSFMHLDHFEVEQILPEENVTYSLEQSLENGLGFEWTNPLEIPQHLQISQLENFSKLISDDNLNATVKKLNLSEKGQYYWRVGYSISDKMYWSKVSSFILKSERIRPLVLNKIPKTLDFSLRKTFPVKVIEPVGFESYEYVLSQGDKIIDKKISKRPVYQLNFLPDGIYHLKIKAISESKKMEGEINKELNVLTSPPMDAPKIKNKEKVKLFVYVLKTIFNNLFPSAHASSKFFYNLEWEPVPNASYEIEIYKNTKEELFLTKIITEPIYRLNISGPDVYYWRIRTILNDKKGPFSEFASIQIEDKVFSLKKPLMLSPTPDEDLSIIENGTVTFTWQEPISGKYYLEYSTDPEGKKIKRIPVSRGSKTLKFKKAPPTFYWRIHAESLYGNTNPNQERYKLKLDAVENKFPFSKVLTRLALYQSSSDFKITAKEAGLKHNINMTGQIADFNIEFFPNRNRRNSYNFEFRGQALSDGKNKLDEKRVGIEYSWLLNPDSNAHQLFYLGFHQLLQYHFLIDSHIEGDYTASFLSARYLFRRHLTEKFNIELSSLLQMPTAFDFTPSITVKPAINYHLNAKWWIDFYFLYERFYTRPEITSGSQDADITLQNMGLGLGLTWNPSNAPF